MDWLDRLWCRFRGVPYRTWEDWFCLYMLERKSGVRFTEDH